MNPDTLVDNRTPMAVAAFSMDDRHGRRVAVIVAKLTYTVTATGLVQIAIPKSPVRRFDELHKLNDLVQPSSSLPPSIRYPSDMFEEHPGTSVILVGTAYPQGDVNYQDVSLRVGEAPVMVHKLVRVHGPRVWQDSLRGVIPGPAARLSPTPLLYELTYGGIDDSDPGNVIVDDRNPVGQGVARSRSSLIGQRTPCIEDLSAPLTSTNPAPAGFGAMTSTWEPRATYAGTRDEAWLKERAPVRPVDFDPRFHCCAPADLVSAHALPEDAPIQVLGATPEGSWQFRLPRYKPLFHIVLRGKQSEVDTHLDTILLDADQRRVELTWRICVPLPRKAAFLESVIVFRSGQFPDGMIQDLFQRLETADQGPSTEATP